MAVINVKTPAEIEIMQEGGKRLARVKEALREAVQVGVSAKEIDDLAEKLVKEEGGEPSFKKVRDYRWTTCVNINDGVVHGIPHPHIVFKKGDIVSVDVGIFYKGFHTDTSFTKGLDVDSETKKFLEAGQEALNNAIKQAVPGAQIYDISEAMENTLKKHGLNPVPALVGHGIGRNLHEDPQIPCFTSGRRENSPVLPERATIAIEVMYTTGSGEVYIDSKDKWTILTRDGKIASLFEETVAVTSDGPVVLTKQ